MKSYAAEILQSMIFSWEDKHGVSYVVAIISQRSAFNHAVNTQETKFSMGGDNVEAPSKVVF